MLEDKIEKTNIYSKEWHKENNIVKFERTTWEQF